MSRSGLDRCLRRHGVGNLRDLQAKSPRPKHKAFKAYEPGYLHVDVKYLPQMADETSRRYLFVAIDRAPRLGSSSASSSSRPPPTPAGCLTRSGTRLPDADPNHTYGQRPSLGTKRGLGRQITGHPSDRIPLE